MEETFSSLSIYGLKLSITNNRYILNLDLF